MKSSRQQGVALLEFALIAPFLMMLVFITTEFGRAFYQYDTLTKLVRDAARYLSTQEPDSHVEEARNLILYGSTQPGSRSLVVGLEASHIETPEWYPAGTAPLIRVVTVRVSGYQFVPMVSSVFGLPIPTIPFPDITATMRTRNL